MMRTHRVVASLRFLCLSLTLLSGLTAFMVAPAVAQQQGAVVGTVTDAETLRPVAGAQIYIPGTVIGTITNPEGIFRLEGVPAGTITVELRLIGYKDASQTVTVLEGQVVTADFQIQQTALRLQDIVVTGVVAETPRVKLPFTVERIDNEDMPVATSDVSTLLAGKGAGISVASGSGRPGDAADILLRGPTSIDATGRSQAPLIVVDGVIQGEHATLADINALDIDHVEIVKGAAAASLYGSRAQNGVVQITTKRGQSLAVNTFNVTLRGEFGVNQLAGRIGVTSHHSYVMNEDGTKFIDTLGNEVDFGDLGRDGGAILAPPPWDPDGVGTPGTSFQDDEFPGPLYDQLDTFFDPGDTYSLYGAATGRFGESSFRVSFESFRETGVVECSTCELVDGQQVVKDDGYRRYNARLNVDSRLGDQFDIAASGFYSNSDQDNAAEYSGAFFSLPWMSPAVDLTDTAEDDPDYPYNGLPRIDPDPMSNSFNPLYGLAIYDDRRERSRVMGSLDVAWTPITWFSVEGNASYDRTDSEEWIIHPKDELVIYTGRQYQESGGRLYQTSFYSQALNGSLTAGFNYGFLDGDLATRLKVRYVYEDQEFATFDATGLVFTVPEVPSFGNISGAKDATNEIQDIRAEGYFGIASLDYKGRYIVDGLVRRDGSSLFGAKERWQTYWRMSAAWRVAQEAFWGLDWWDELKLRFSVGTAGGRPNFWAQYETYAVSQGNVTPTNLGNTALKPEFTRENEAGVNLVFLQNIGLDVTYAWAETKDQLLQVPMPGFVGFSSQWQNAGTIKSNTWEASLRYAAIDRPDLGLTFRLTWDRTTNEITALGVPAYGVPGFFYIAEGESMASTWGSRWATTCTDVAGQAGFLGTAATDFCNTYGNQFQVNDDGYMVWVGEDDWQDGIARGLWGTSSLIEGTTFNWGHPIESKAQRRTCLRDHPDDLDMGVECPLSTYLPLGDATPRWNGAFFTNFRYKGVSLALLLDATVGHEIYNNTRNRPHRDWRAAESDQFGKPDANKKPVEYYSILYNTADPSSHFMEDASWLKFREVSLGYSLPQAFLDKVFRGTVDRLSLNLIGRNLFTITSYQGYDPETGFSGGAQGSAALARYDSFRYPNFRSITASLEVVF